ncbi:MAG: calcium-binding protein [Pseudomonadota bacterium]
MPTITGTPGNDSLTGGPEDDGISGEAGDDTLRGGPGRDDLNGGLGNDLLDGGDGDDWIRTSRGKDTLTGGAGRDVFDIHPYSLYFPPTANDVNIITDFTVGDAGDMIRIPYDFHEMSTIITGNPFGDGYVRLTQSGADTLVELDTDGKYRSNDIPQTVLVLKNVNKDDLTAWNFYGSEPNVFVGTADNNTLTGNERNSVMAGRAGNDSLTAFGGNDTLHGQDGDDILISGNGKDALYGEKNNDRLDAGADDDYLSGGAGSDTLIGGSGNDFLSDGVESDKLNGGSGNDTLEGGAGNDTLIGGTGQDVFVLRDFISESETPGRAIITDFVAGDAGDQIVLPYYYFFNTQKTGNHFVDRLVQLRQSGADTWLEADLDGSSGAGGFQVLAILRNVNMADLTAFNFQGLDPHPVLGSTGDDSLNGNNTDNMMLGNAGNDTLVGLEGNDSLYGQAGNDSLMAGLGNDTLDSGLGQDTLVGGDGSDVYFVDDAGDVVLETNADKTTGGIDLVISNMADYTLGEHVENGRVDLYSVGNMMGNSLSNILYSSWGNNVLDGGAGSEADTASYKYAAYGVRIRLAVTTAQTTEGAGKDTLIRIENLVGSNANDTLSGSSAANEIDGGAGNDTLGGGGGKDTLTGGSGNDVFVYNLLSDSGPVSSKWDVITDFVRGQDRIDLSALDANTATTTNTAFTRFIGSTDNFTAVGQLKFSGGVLYGNTDADAAAEFAIELTGISELDLTDLIA